MTVGLPGAQAVLAVDVLQWAREEARERFKLAQPNRRPYFETGMVPTWTAQRTSKTLFGTNSVLEAVSFWQVIHAHLRKSTLCSVEGVEIAQCAALDYGVVLVPNAGTDEIRCFCPWPPRSLVNSISGKQCRSRTTKARGRWKALARCASLLCTL